MHDEMCHSCSRTQWKRSSRLILWLVRRFCAGEIIVGSRGEGEGGVEYIESPMQWIRAAQHCCTVQRCKTLLWADNKTVIYKQWGWAVRHILFENNLTMMI